MGFTRRPVQLAVHGAPQSCGIGAILIQAAEQQIRARGLDRAELGVEERNPRARALYERLGYLAYGREPASWDEEASDGSLTRYETICTLMRKELPWGAAGRRPPGPGSANPPVECPRRGGYGGIRPGAAGYPPVQSGDGQGPPAWQAGHGSPGPRRSGGCT
jgi:hypothetical protein